MIETRLRGMTFWGYLKSIKILLNCHSRESGNLVLQRLLDSSLRSLVLESRLREFIELSFPRKRESSIAATS
jgi:hypothetical protein